MDINIDNELTTAPLIKTKSPKHAAFQSFISGMVLAFCLFMFQTIILNFVLFTNRQFNKDSLTKCYIANYMDWD